MNVLLIDNSNDFTGASKALLKAAEELKVKGITFVFVFPKGSKCVSEVRERGYEVYEIKFQEIRKKASAILLYFPKLIINTFRLRKISKRHKVRVVHMNDMYNMLGLCLKISSKVKIVTHVRMMPASYPAVLYKTWRFLNNKFADRIVAVSEANKKAFGAAPKTTVIYDPLPDDEQLPPYTPRPAINDKVQVLYLANYIDGKGQLHALKALAALKNQPDVKNIAMNFYGGFLGLKKNEEYKESLEKFAMEIGISDKVSFNDKTTAIESVMKAHDVVLNFSDSESFSRVTLEALFFGLPVIATSVGGTAEMIADGESGLLVTAKDVTEMAKALERLVADDGLRCKTATNAYKFVREKFATSISTDQLYSIYTGL